MRSSLLFALIVRACSLDLDHDGYSPAATVAGMADCDDNNPAVHPGADELCGAIDENCDGDPEAGAVDGPCSLPDGDGDGYDATVDCDDADATVHPGALEICGDGVDQNCAADCAWAGTNLDSDADQSFEGQTASAGASSGFLGGNLAGRGDINGDGYADVAIGDRVYDNSTASFNQGRVYLLSGSSTGLVGDISAPTAMITGNGVGDRLGGGVGMVEDLNGDGMDELVVGASTDNYTGRSDAGSAFLFRGPLSGTGMGPADADLTIEGDAASDYAGWVVGGAGDLTGDHVPDWVVSAYFANSLAGKVAIVDGSLADGSYALANLGRLYSGQSASERFGAWADGQVDVNGDGSADLVVAAVGTTSVSIWFGPLPVGGGGAVPDVVITGVELTTNTTSSEANCINCLGTAGDVTDDGYEDLLIGSDGSDLGNQADAGAAYVMAGPIGASTSTSAAAATILGFAANDFVGRSVAGGGDIDLDGRDDLLISAHGHDVVDGEGRVALVYGPVAGTTYHHDLPGFLGTEVRANLGAALAMVGDVDGDLAEDFVLGAPNAVDAGGAGVGRAYFYFGAGE